MSHTKLSREQSEWLKEEKLDFQNIDGEFFNFYNYTIAIKPAFFGSKMAKVSLAIMSENEEKFKHRVGEFSALVKMKTGEFIQVSCDVEDFADFAENFADFLWESKFI